MYCYNCGKQIDEKAVVCTHCGVQVGQFVRVQSFSVAGFVLSFFGWLSILGLLFSCIGYKKSVEQKNGTGVELAIAGILVSICDFVGFVAGMIVYFYT